MAEWYYLDADEAQVGPVGLAVVSSLPPSTLVWKEGMGDWAHIRAALAAAADGGEAGRWHYLAEGGTKQRGDAAALWTDGRVGAGTLVWTEGMADWCVVRDLHADLRLEFAQPGGSGGSTAPTAAPPTAQQHQQQHRHSYDQQGKDRPHRVGPSAISRSQQHLISSGDAGHRTLALMRSAEALKMIQARRAKLDRDEDEAARGRTTSGAGAVVADAAAVAAAAQAGEPRARARSQSSRTRAQSQSSRSRAGSTQSSAVAAAAARASGRRQRAAAASNNDASTRNRSDMRRIQSFAVAASGGARVSVGEESRYRSRSAANPDIAAATVADIAGTRPAAISGGWRTRVQEWRRAAETSAVLSSQQSQRQSEPQLPLSQRPVQSAPPTHHDLSRTGNSAVRLEKPITFEDAAGRLMKSSKPTHQTRQGRQNRQTRPRGALPGPTSKGSRWNALRKNFRKIVADGCKVGEDGGESKRSVATDSDDSNTTRAERAVKLQQMYSELVESEAIYVDQIQKLIGDLILPLREADVLAVEDDAAIFSNVESLIAVNMELLRELEEGPAAVNRHWEGGEAGCEYSCERKWQYACETIVKLLPFFRMYKVYCSNYFES